MHCHVHYSSWRTSWMVSALIRDPVKLLRWIVLWKFPYSWYSKSRCFELYLKVLQTPEITQCSYPLLWKHLAGARTKAYKASEFRKGRGRCKAVQHLLESITKMLFCTIFRANKPKHFKTADIRKRQFRHNQTWDSGMMGDFIWRKEKKWFTVTNRHFKDI